MFAIAAGDIIKYQGGQMMRNADARRVRSRQVTFNKRCPIKMDKDSKMLGSDKIWVCTYSTHNLVFVKLI